uniref:Ig-like domain-containing protein n=1 Tax=Amphilophus citrinellus TaxID=61819 RepID=A0A3Q0R0L9_AMPCI
MFLRKIVLCCSDEQIFETETVHAGEKIKLTCTRRSVGTFFWMKVVSGKFPKILGKSFSFQSFDQRIRTATEPETFALYITKTEQSDTGAYFCMKTGEDLEFLKGTFLKTSKYTVVQEKTVPSGDSMSLQCSLLAESDNKSCPGDLNVLWFRAGSNKSHPNIIYADRNRRNEYETRSETQQSCVFRFSKNVSSSDAGTYYCAVATCGEILFGNGTTLDIQVMEICVIHFTYVRIFLYYFIDNFLKIIKQSEALNYAALNFSERKTRGRRKREFAEDSVYSQVAC